VWRQQRILVEDLTFTGNNEIFGHCYIISSCGIYSCFIAHDELSGMPISIVLQERN
jgi:hypothetical protein